MDSFQYDPNTNRPVGLRYMVNATSNAFQVNTALTWNANGSLQQMAYTDTNDTSKSQTCTYSADDLGRIASVSCGSNTWAQNFSYDPMGNINKTGVGNATSYNAAYSEATNQVSGGPAYDANGNQKNSTGLSSIAWNANGQPASVTPLSGGPVTGTYDALGRLVENAPGSTYTQFIFSPSGQKIADYRSGLLKGMVPLPGGATAIYSGTTGMPYIRHLDWLGSARLSTTWTHSVQSKVAYAPFGETYNEAGASANDRSFTGQEQDTVSGSAATGIYDFLFRKYDPAAGRWLSPDPYGWGAATEGDPQSMNRYSYVTNRPLESLDPDGLSCYTNWIPQSNGSLVSVQVDDGDGRGCAAANVAPSTPQDPTGTNDGTPGAQVNGGPDASEIELDLLLGQFQLGIGPITMIYQSTDPLTLSFQSSAGMDAINAHIAANCSAMRGKGSVGSMEAFENTVIDGIFGGAGFGTPEAQMGAFKFDYVRDGGKVSVTVTNPVSMNSLFYHAPAKMGIQNPKSGPLSTINQILQIEGADPCY